MRDYRVVLYSYLIISISSTSFFYFMSFTSNFRCAKSHGSALNFDELISDFQMKFFHKKRCH